MTQSLNLIVDVDDVLIPTMASIHAIAEERGLHNGDAPMAWSGWESYGCHPDDYWACWAHFAATGGYTSTPPIEGAAEALRWLYWEGHTIHLVTARGFFKDNGERIKAWTREWVEEFAIPHHTLTFAQDKVGAQETLGVKFDAGIDDSPKNYSALEAAGVHMYLQDHDHNRDFSPPFLRRVETLWEWAFQLEKAFPDARLA